MHCSGVNLLLARPAAPSIDNRRHNAARQLLLDTRKLCREAREYPGSISTPSHAYRSQHRLTMMPARRHQQFESYQRTLIRAKDTPRNAPVLPQRSMPLQLTTTLGNAQCVRQLPACNHLCTHSCTCGNTCCWQPRVSNLSSELQLSACTAPRMIPVNGCRVTVLVQAHGLPVQPQYVRASPSPTSVTARSTSTRVTTKM